MLGVINGDKSKYTCEIEDAKVNIERARTRAATNRNNALRKAADLLKAKPGMVAKDVAIVWAGGRGVTVKGVFAFEQPAGNDLGQFVGMFKDESL